jgi:type I restriction enzyme R subunit
MTFNQPGAVEVFVRDRLCGGVTHYTGAKPGFARRKGRVSGLGWHFLAPRTLARLQHEVMVERHVREALVRLNHEVASQPGRAAAVFSRLRAILTDARTDGLVKANEEFTAWLRGDRSLPFEEGGEHAPIRLIDFSDVERNQYIVTTKFIYRAGASKKRADVVLLVNGIPVVVIQTKPSASRSWFDLAREIHQYDERSVPELFVPNLLSIVTDGEELRYGSVGLPVKLWGTWHTEAGAETPVRQRVGCAIESMLRPDVILDLVANFSAYATDENKRPIKIVARQQEYEATNAIVERVVAGNRTASVIWHSEGSDTSRVMLFAARKLMRHPELMNPTVLMVVDPIEVEGFSAVFGAFTPSLARGDSRAELQRLLAQDSGMVVITTPLAFADAGGGVLNDRTNIVVMMDEAHRTHGGLGRNIREALPHAFLLGLTGRAIDGVDCNPSDHEQQQLPRDGGVEPAVCKRMPDHRQPI